MRQIGAEVDFDNLRPGDYIYFCDWDVRSRDQDGYFFVEYYLDTERYSSERMRFLDTSGNTRGYHKESFCGSRGNLNSGWLYGKLGGPPKKPGFARFIQEKQL